MAAKKHAPLDLDAARALIAFADRGSVQRAAKEQGVSRSTLRRRLDELEAVVGVPLVHKDAQGGRLTRAGVVLVERARGLVERADQAVLDARAAATEAGGLVRIGVASGMPESLVCQQFAGIQSAGLDIRVSLTELPTPLSSQHNALDLMFHFGPPPEADGWFSRVLHRMRAHLVASPDYLAARGEPQDVEALAEHTLLMWRGPLHAPDHLPLLAGGAVRVSPALISPDVSLLRRAASTVGGLAFAPDGSVPDDPGIGLLVPVLDSVVGRSEVFRVSSRLPSRVDPRAAAFAQRVYELFRDLPER